MAIPLLGKRRERRNADIATAVEAAVGKAMVPAEQRAVQVEGIPGATYPVAPPSSPFAQTGGSYASKPLPRSFEEFSSLFGPAYPLAPDALDPVGQRGRAEPRRRQYPVAENIQIGRFGKNWHMLRTIADEVDVVARCIELVQDALTGMEWSWGFSHARSSIRSGWKITSRTVLVLRLSLVTSTARNSAVVQKFWERPDERMGYTFTQWLTLAVWAHLVYDGIAVRPRYTLGGDLHSLSIIDTATIKILLDNYGFMPAPPSPAYQQILYGFPRSEFQTENVEGPTDPEYSQDQLAYYIRRPRLHTEYGFSAVEECINYATLYMQRQEWMHAEWSHGVTPKLPTRLRSS